MHLAGWSAVLLSAMLLMQSATEAAGRAGKSSSLEDELESSLPQPEHPGEQQLKAAAAAAAEAAGRDDKKTEPNKPQQQHHEIEKERAHSVEQKQKTKQLEGRHSSRQDLRTMFRHLLESMTEAERKSLTLRLGQENVKRTFSQMRDEVRALPGAAVALPVRKRVALAPSEAKAAVLRMRRSALLSAMESGMPAARQRRRKRDLMDYSPEEYDQLVAMLAKQPAGYVEDAEGNIRLADGEAENKEAENGDGEDGKDIDEERKRRRSDSEVSIENDANEDVEERSQEEQPRQDGAEDAEADDDRVDDYKDDDADARDAVASLTPPERHPLTMFLVRMAGEKGLFVPLDQDKAEQLAVELSGEAAVAEAAEAQAEAEAEAEAEANAEADAERRSQLEAAGVAELKRFAEKLARRVPPGY